MAPITLSLGKQLGLSTLISLVKCFVGQSAYCVLYAYKSTLGSTRPSSPLALRHQQLLLEMLGTYVKYPTFFR